jgi:hypothetical protein
MLAVALKVCVQKWSAYHLQFVLRERMHCIMLVSAIVSTRLRTSLLKPYVKCSFTELIRKAMLSDNAESTSPVAYFVETHEKVNWSLTDFFVLCIQGQSIKKPNIWNSAPLSRRWSFATVVLCSGDFKLYFDTSHMTSLQLVIELRGLEWTCV